ncbi:hypothetical protein HDV05_000709 [Chytridiales sp. JEL 0842]|nr:hypothetical protein HDV05_000709 [Chytridiales sp. JEL 0842]
MGSNNTSQDAASTHSDAMTAPVTKEFHLQIEEDSKKKASATSRWIKTREKRNNMHRANNTGSEHWKDIFRIRASVIPPTIIPTLLLTAWSAFVTVFYMVPSVNFLRPWLPNSTLLITVLGVVMGLLLVFRTNTSYDRYWEGRRMWGTVQTQVRNLTRFTWICVVTKNEEQFKQKKGAMNLILAFAAATKHYLRDEPGFKYTDLGPLLEHLPDFSEARDSDPASEEVSNLPLEISFHLQSYVAYCRKTEQIDVAVQGQMLNSISALVDSLTSFERIRTSPIPFAYSIHLKQTLLLYLLSLPFQLAPSIFWGNIPAVFIASFTLLGIEAIGGEIENPFGYDDNDLPQEEYLDVIREEMAQIMKNGLDAYDSSKWLEAYQDLSISHLGEADKDK